MTVPEPARQTGHVFLDLLSAVSDDDVDDDAAATAAGTAVGRLNEIGAFTFELAGDTIVVDGTMLVTGVTLVVQALVEDLAEARGVSKLEVLVAARERLDEP